MEKTENQNYQEKADFYHAKKMLMEERIMLIKGQIGSESDKIKVNSYKMEILDLEASLEGINNYWNHFMERLQAIEVREKTLTAECEDNFKRYYDIFTSISPANLKQHSGQIQEQYNKILPVLDKEWPQLEKNALYSLMKDLLQKMKKI